MNQEPEDTYYLSILIEFDKHPQVYRGPEIWTKQNIEYLESFPEINVEVLENGFREQIQEQMNFCRVAIPIHAISLKELRDSMETGKQTGYHTFYTKMKTAVPHSRTPEQTKIDLYGSVF